jgi:hypothetical protein
LYVKTCSPYVNGKYGKINGKAFYHWLPKLLPCLAASTTPFEETKVNSSLLRSSLLVY